jgi:polyvinyl alcohol dehydrogenase (cytochrome)
VYIATGNNYSVPQSVLDCVAANAGNPTAIAACSDANNHFDSIMALNMRTGAIRWVTRALPFDAWTVDCFFPPPFDENCPDPQGPDYDFGQAPALYKTRDAITGKSIELVGAGQKSGQYWALNPDTGEVKWVTQAGPGGTAGGLQWGSAVDGTRVYTANANSLHTLWVPKDGVQTDSGAWSALDAATGELLWQHVPSVPGGGFGGNTSGPVTTANGVVYGCSLDDAGNMYALNAANGDELWNFASGGSCLSGAAIADGMLYWGSGYSNAGFGTPNHKLYAFGLQG